jgi:alanyl-tRNA synthetase
MIMDTTTTVRTFVDFYRERGHRRVIGTSLIPGPGDLVLFTAAGMHPLTPYLEGRPHPLGRRLYNLQRCLRTTDLDEVGDFSHLTVFQMLGSWSLGDYDGPQSLRWGYELLTQGFGIEPGRLHATVFGGDEQVGVDEESLAVWTDLGVPVERCGEEDNWWSNGPVGPCGPDSEIFVWVGDGPPVGTPTRDERWMEVWNHVMMRYHRQPDGSLTPLRQRSVDTGLGLERLLMVLQGRSSVYETDLLAPWVEIVRKLWDLDGSDLRLVVDHLRSAVVITGDGVVPASSGRGYVLRRVIRRSLTTLWARDESPTLSDLPLDLLVRTLEQFEQSIDLEPVRDVLSDEERRFRSLVHRGRSIVERQRERSPDGLTSDDFTYLHETHGLPPELVVSLLTH